MIATGVCLVLLSLLLLGVPFLVSGDDLWLGIDWIDGRKLYSIDDAYRYFVAKNATAFPTVFLWNYILPVALLFDLLAAALTDGSLLGMRLIHAGIGALTLVVIVRASLRAGCGPALALASALIVGLMPIFLVLSSSFYGEGLFALLLACAFLLLIENRRWSLAVLVGLLPLVRPDGAIYSLLFLLYFGQRRDYRACVLVALPALLYFFALVLLSDDWLASVGWRLELRKILDPFDSNLAQPLSIDRWLSPLWVGLGLAAPFFREYRKWWPILLGPWLHIGIQVLGIARGVQDFELRYYFALLPVFAVAWAFPVQKLLDAVADVSTRRLAVRAATVAGVAVVISSHLLQSDWVRDGLGRSPVPQDDPRIAGREFSERSPWFDPRPLRGFAGRVDRYLETHNEVQTLFIANPAPLYFLDYPSGRSVDTILIPHNPGIASYSGGYFFGFSLEQLSHRYYRFNPGEPSVAMLIVDDAGQNPLGHHAPGERGVAARANGSRTSASIQSGSMKAFEVNFSDTATATWSMPAQR